MNTVSKTIATVLALVAVFLFLSRGGETVKIINALGTNSVQGIRVLQGRG